MREGKEGGRYHSVGAVLAFETISGTIIFTGQNMRASESMKRSQI